tara:strand:+ start:8024 stop:8302 length:279 start_codon:yes stop_codon:yes gene_type:complete
MVLEQVMDISEQVRTQSLTAIVGGFSFASAIAWMDAVRWSISQVVKVQRNGGTYYVLTALFTTLLAVMVFTVINLFTKVEKPDKPVYAVARV